MKDTRVKEKFVFLRVQGLSFDRISEELGISKPTLIQWQKELEKQIAELKFFEFESLLSQYQMLKEQRIKKLGEKLEKVRAEIERRDFIKDLPLPELLEMEKTIEEKLKAEIQGIAVWEERQESSLDFFKTERYRRFSIE